jgi:glutamate 5-kinase
VAALTETRAPDLAGTARLVVKIGSALLVDRDSGALRAEWLRALALELGVPRFFDSWFATGGWLRERTI